MVAVPAPSGIFGDSQKCRHMIFSGAHVVRPKTIRVFRDATVLGWRLLGTPDGVYWSGLTESVSNLSQLSENLHEGVVFSDDRLHFYAAPDSFSREYDGVSLFLGHLEPGNHGSFLFRLLPRILFVLERGLSFDLLVVPQRTEGLLELLDFLGIECLVLSVREVAGCRFKKVVAVDDFDPEGVFSSGCVRRIERLAGAVSARIRSNRKAIYVSRQLQARSRPKYRPLMNEAEVEGVVRAHGFSPVFPETMPLMRQVALFAQAERIVGPSGSGMLGAMFARKGVPVLDLESFTYTVRQHGKIYGSTGKAYAFAFGAALGEDGPEVFRPWAIDLKVVSEALELGFGNR